MGPLPGETASRIIRGETAQPGVGEGVKEGFLEEEALCRPLL